ncbi:Cyanovirin-N [Aspergillus uvarum CBS 121591]|uniref:Cyanovirin-N n=1 Tax=Aspergillus uvarum CBS 121591 TaxID=1448315 RepID=A0A319BT12_9EURO|nr:Cyanovirin-N [Aspergillus uvarum CBS 121591]PYH75611.1 Cyanovirin-N [Aspergillus uvarum CBS 121591]
MQTLWKVSIFIVAIQRASAVGNFASSCRDVTLSKAGLLEAQCYDSSQGIWVLTALELQDCYANYNGSFVAAIDGDENCKMIQLQDNRYMAISECQELGNNAASEDQLVDLNDHVVNIDGHLHCLE